MTVYKSSVFFIFLNFQKYRRTLYKFATLILLPTIPFESFVENRQIIFHSILRRMRRSLSWFFYNSKTALIISPFHLLWFRLNLHNLG